MTTPNELNALQTPDRSYITNHIGIINVKNYGAVGDGTTNDTTAINKAVTAASANGNKSLYFPTGTYLVDAGLSDLSSYYLWGDNASFSGSTYTIEQLGPAITTWVDWTPAWVYGGGVPVVDIKARYCLDGDTIYFILECFSHDGNGIESIGFKLPYYAYSGRFTATGVQTYGGSVAKLAPIFSVASAFMSIGGFQTVPIGTYFMVSISGCYEIGTKV